MNNSEYFSYDALGLAELVRTKQISSIELLEVAIALTEKLDPKLNAVPIKHFELARENLKNILATPNIGILKQGFWWEFYARANSLGIEIVEAPIEHRVRAAGETVVYRPTKVPAIAYEHIVGLRTLRNTLRNN